MKQIQDINMKTPVDILRDVEHWIMCTNDPNTMYNEMCFDGDRYYVITLFVQPGSCQLFVHTYIFDQNEHKTFQLKPKIHDYSIPSPETKPTIKDMILDSLQEDLHIVPVLNDSYEFLYRGKHFLVDTCTNNPQICVVFDADDDYKPVLSVGLESDDELAPGKEVPDYILRLMY